MNRSITAAALAAIFATALASAALADPYDPNASWDAVVAAAKKEGVLNVYSSASGGQFFTDVTDAFTKKYGIKVNKLEARGAELMERIRVEGTNNK